jgi:hypothetical protein
MSKSLTKLMAEAIALKEGDKEAVLNYLPVESGKSWEFGIGNPSKNVLLNESTPQFCSAYHATPKEAVRDVIDQLKGAKK